MTYYFIAIPVAVALGAAMGYLTKVLFAKFPEEWLQDYGVKETDVNYRISKRMRLVPEAVVAMAVCAAMYVAFVIFCKGICFDVFRPLLWFSSEAAWYYPLISKVGAALIGGGFLFLIGFLALTFTGREGMGQGDMRLLLATGLITGIYGLVVLVYVAIGTALLFAIPMLIRKHIRIREEEELIRNSKNPQKLRRALEIKKARMHFADDPDYLAFGPFIALGCGVFAVMEPFFHEQLMNYLSGLGVFF